MRKQLNVTGRGGIRGQDYREHKAILEHARDIEFTDCHGAGMGATILSSGVDVFAVPWVSVAFLITRM